MWKSFYGQSSVELLLLTFRSCLRHFDDVKTPVPRIQVNHEYVIELNLSVESFYGV